MANELDPYGVQGALPVQPYDANSFVANQASNYLQQYVPAAPVVPITPALPIGGETAAPAGPRKSNWESFLEANQANIKTPEDFEKYKEMFRLGLQARLFAKKMPEAGVEATLQSFDKRAEMDMASMFKDVVDPTISEQQRKNAEGSNQLTENVAAFLGGAAQVVPGAMSLVDLAVRGGNAIRDSMLSVPGAVLSGDLGKLKDFSLGGKTAVGEAGDDLSRLLQNYVKANTSKETLEQQKLIQEKLGEDAGFFETIVEQISNPRTAAMLVSGGVSTLVPIGSTAKLLSMAGKLQKMGATAKTVASSAPTMVALAAQDASEFEKEVRGMQMEDIYKRNPDLLDLREALRQNGIVEDVDSRIRQHVIDRGVGLTFTSSLAANLGTVATPGLGGVERAAAGAMRKGNQITRRAKGALSEGTQEAIAGGTEGIGANVGFGDPALEGSAKGAALGIVAGAPAGAVFPGTDTPSVGPGAALGRDKLKRPKGADVPLDSKLKTKPGREPAPAGTPSNPAATATAGAAAPAEDAFTDAPVAGMPGGAFAQVTGAFEGALLKATAKLKNAKNVSDPSNAIAYAEQATQIMAGSAWDKLDATQRMDLIERTVTALSRVRKIEGLPEALTMYKAARLPSSEANAPLVETPLPPDLVQQPPVETQPTAEVAPPVAEAPTDILPAPTITPPVQETTQQLQDKLKAAGRARMILQRDFGMPMDELQDLKPDDLRVLLETKLAERSALQAKAVADADARVAEAQEAKDTPRKQQTPTKEVKDDDRVVGTILTGRKHADRPLRKAVKQMAADITGLVTPKELEGMTVGQLRELHKQQKTTVVPQQTKIPRTRSRAKGKGKTAPSNGPVTARARQSTIPATEPKNDKTVEGGTYDTAKMKALTGTKPKKADSISLRKAREEAKVIAENLEAERARDPKGVPSKTKIADMDLAQARKYYEDLVYERSRRDTGKNVEAKPEATDMERGLALISELGSKQRPVDVIEVPISTAKVNDLQAAFLDAVRSGNTKALRNAVIETEAFGPRVDAIVQAAKDEHNGQLARFESFEVQVDEGKTRKLNAKERTRMLEAYLDYLDGKMSKSKFRASVQSITNDVTGKGPDAILITAADRERATLPKTSAPPTRGAKTKNSENENKSESKLTVTQQLREWFPQAENTTINELVEAIELAQQGDNSLLEKTLKEAIANEEITKADTKDIRALAAQPYKTPRALLKEELEALVEESELEELPAVRMAENILLEMEVEEETGNVPSATQQAISDLEAELLSSDDILKALNLQDKPARGHDKIVARLIQLRRNPGLREAIDFALWLIEANPNVTNYLGLTTAKLDISGGYDPMRAMVVINESAAEPRTIVHEILHHTERMMPLALQDKIRGEYAGRLANKFKQAKARGDIAAQKYLMAVNKYHLSPTDENKKAAVTLLSTKPGEAGLNFSEYYKYLNSSEYFAETASEILRRRQQNTGWVAELKEWFREFVARLKSLLGWDNTHAVYLGLKNVMGTEGEADAGTLIRKGNEVANLEKIVGEAASEEEPEDDVPEENDPYLQTDADVVATQEETKKQAKVVRTATEEAGTFQHIWENLTNNVYAFEKVEQALNKVKGVLNTDNSPRWNFMIYNGRVSFNNKIDRAEVMDKAVEFVDKNWATYTHDKEAFVEALNRFFGNMNFKERIKTDWLMNVPLNKGMEARRDDIIERFKQGELSPDAARNSLETLVKRYAARDIRDHAIKRGVSEETFDAIQDTLDSLFRAGIDAESMQELNDLLDPVRDRIRQRLVEAGYFPEDDPWTAFYGWKWYVPLKGVASEANDIVSQNAFDMIPQDKLSLARLSKQIKAMEGRTTFGQRPFERLFVDMARAGERSAHREFAHSLYELVTDNPSLGADIKVYKGTPRNGYVDPLEDIEDGDEPTVFSSVPKPRNGQGFIFNDGDTHYVITLPRNSQLLRGLILSNNVNRPPEWIKKYIAAPTNVIARAHTTLSPFWQTGVGFVRDLTTLPTTIAVENFDNPLDSVSFFARYGTEVLGLYRAAPVFWESLQGDVNALTRRAEEEPESYAGWLRRWEVAGGANDFTQAFSLEGVSEVFKGTLDQVDGVWDATKYGYKWVEKYTGNYANFLESASRVAAFKTLNRMYPEKSDKEIAVMVRRVLDYQQTGLWGRNINSVIAFYRVGMTGMDTIRRSFTKSTGEINKTKLALWTSTLSGISAFMYFAIGSMMGDDDEGVKKMHKMRAASLTQKMFAPLGDSVVGLNIGLGVPQLLMAPGILAAAVSDGHLTMEQAAAELYATVIRNGPIRLQGVKDPTPTNWIANTLQGMLPTLVSPLFALDENVDVFGRPIHVSHEQAGLPHPEQGRASTPKEFATVARVLYDITGGLVNYYPEDIKYIATNYGGQNVADLIKTTIDLDAKNNIGIEATYNPVTSRFEVKDEDYYDQDRMYALLDEASESTARYKTIVHRAKEAGLSEFAAKQLGNKFLREHPEEKKVIDAAKKLTKLRNDRSEAVRKLSRDRVTSVARKQALRKEWDSKMRAASNELDDILEQLE